MATRKSPQDGNWARGSTRSGRIGHGAKASASNRSKLGVQTFGRKEIGLGKFNSEEADFAVNNKINFHPHN